METQAITHLLCSTRHFLGSYPSTGLKKYWFPDCYDDALIYPIPAVKKVHPVGFCGNVNNRGPYLDLIDGYFASLKHPMVKRDIFVIGRAMVKAINSYQIHFNRNISIDLNYRTFETARCNTFVLTNYTAGLEELFDIGRELVTYDSGETLIEKLRYYLDNPDEREAIAVAGYARAKRDHTYKNRASRLLEILSGQ